MILTLLGHGGLFQKPLGQVNFPGKPIADHVGSIHWIESEPPQ